jgi:hypothetical protein
MNALFYLLVDLAQRNLPPANANYFGFRSIANKNILPVLTVSLPSSHSEPMIKHWGAWMRIFKTFTLTGARARARTNTHTHARAHVYAIHTHSHTHTHARTHTHTRAAATQSVHLCIEHWKHLYCPKRIFVFQIARTIALLAVVQSHANSMEIFTIAEDGALWHSSLFLFTQPLLGCYQWRNCQKCDVTSINVIISTQDWH